MTIKCEIDESISALGKVEGCLSSLNVDNRSFESFFPGKNKVNEYNIDAKIISMRTAYEKVIQEFKSKLFELTDKTIVLLNNYREKDEACSNEIEAEIAYL